MSLSIRHHTKIGRGFRLEMSVKVPSLASSLHLKTQIASLSLHLTVVVGFFTHCLSVS